MKLVLFDIDGTLISSGGAGVRSLERASTEIFGVENGMRGIAVDGMTDKLIVRDLWRAHRGRDPEPGEFDSMIARYLAFLVDELERSTRFRVLPGVEGAITHCEARGHTIGLATGNMEAGARIKLERAGIWRRFAFGGFGDDAADRGALVAAGIRRGAAIARRAFTREEIFVIGDTPRDVAAAHAAGAIAIGVATGSSTVADLLAAGAEHAIPSLDSVSEII